MGKCCLSSIFIEDAESSWTFVEKTRVLENLSLAVYFIKDTARKYNVDVEFIMEKYGFNGEVKYEGIIPADMFAHPFWTEEAIKLIGHAGGNSAVDYLKKKYAVEQVLFIYCINKMGPSYNLTFSNGVSPEWHAERIVLFSKYNNGNSLAAASIVHEILHSFGAGELYFPFDMTDKRKEIAGKYFPDDVMFRVDYEIARLNIGSYTAYRIGWIDKTDKDFEIFEDYD